MEKIPKLPVAGDQYCSALHPGQHCKVISVFDDQVLFQWLEQEAFVQEHSLGIKQFVRIFQFCEAKQASAAIEKILKLPITGDKYCSVLHPGQHCKVISVSEDQVHFRWLGTYAYINEQSAAIKDFVTDFQFCEAKPEA